MNTDKPEARQRLRQQLAELVRWLETDDERPELFGSTDEYEWLLRLAGVVGSLLAHHQVDSHGCCEWCRHRRYGWRRFVPRRTSRTACHVVSTAWSCTTSELDVVWWQVFNMTNEKISLETVRDWLRGNDQPEERLDTEPRHTAREGRHARNDDLLASQRATTVEPQPVRPYVGPTMPTVWFFRQSHNPSATETEELPKINGL